MSKQSILPDAETQTLQGEKMGKKREFYDTNSLIIKQKVFNFFR